MRRLLPLLLVLPLLVPQAARADDAVAFRFLQANIGNVNLAACNDQAVKICLAPVEARLSERLTELAPDVVALQEVLPALVCLPPAKAGDFGTPATSPSLANPFHLCNPAVRDAFADPDQLDRLLPPRVWETRCNAPLIDPASPDRVIPPWDCLGVRRSAGRLTGFVTLPGSVPGVVPGETCDNGFTVSIGQLELAGRPLQLTTAHPDSGAARAGCRAEKLTRMFAGLAERDVPTIVSGDMNLDPYRAPDASTQVWDAFVGAGKAYPYRSGTVEADPAPFTSNICGLSQEDPTGQLLDLVQPPTGPCASTLDHVAASADVVGPCDTLGEAPGDSARLDGGGGMDHRGIACSFTLTAAATPVVADPPAAGSPAAGSPVATPPAGPPGPTPPAATAALPATGGGSTVPLLGVVVLAGVLLHRRRAGSAAR